jgi:hypothetical protein
VEEFSTMGIVTTVRGLCRFGLWESPDRTTNAILSVFIVCPGRIPFVQ